MIGFDAVTLRYATGPAVLQDLSFDFEPGSFHYIFGPSGAGKSSLLRLMHLALVANEGRITLFGQDVGNMARAARAEIRRQIGVVFQDFRLLSHLTALENVLLTQEITGRLSARSQGEASELLAWVGLGDHLDSYPPTLSGGQQQRIAIARAVVGRPRLLIADEPTGNVDDHLAVRLFYLFEELNRLGTTLVVATHNKTLVTQFRHPMLFLHKSRGRLTGPRPARPRRRTSEDEFERADT